MCMMDNQPVDGYTSPCGSCPDYLAVCAPVIQDGYVAGAECDFSVCGFCPIAYCPERDGEITAVGGGLIQGKDSQKGKGMNRQEAFCSCVARL